MTNEELARASAHIKPRRLRGVQTAVGRLQEEIGDDEPIQHFDLIEVTDNRNRFYGVAAALEDRIVFAINLNHASRPPTTTASYP